MKDKYRYLSENVFLFMLSGFIPKILSFILIPLYTGYLTTEEYGISDLIVTTASLLIPIFTLDIQDAVMRYALDRKYNKTDVFSVAINITIKGGAIVTLIAMLISILNINGIEDSYLFFVVIMYFSMSFYNVLSMFCRGIDKIKVLTISSILNSIITLASNILFLAFFKLGLIGFLISNTLGFVISDIFVFISAKLWNHITFKVNKDTKREMISFSVPLIFSVIAWWVNNVSDRYILTWMAGVSVSGIYALSYKIPNLLSMFQNIFTQAWSVSAVKEFDKNDSDGFIGNTYTLMNCSMMMLCSIILMINVPIAFILYSNEFFVAWKYVPPLLVSVVFNAMALFIGSLFTAIKDTKTLAVSTIIGAIVNTVLNFILIYYFQAMGAAVSTMIGYAVTLIIRHIRLRKHIVMKIRMKRDIAAYFVLIFQMCISCLGIKYIIPQLIFAVLLCLLYRSDFKNIAKLLLRRIKCKVTSRTPSE